MKRKQRHGLFPEGQWPLKPPVSFTHKKVGLKEPVLYTVIKKVYEQRGLISFFTAGEKETKAWTVPRGAMVTPEAAGVIHSDFQKGFIRAEVYSCKELVEHQSEKILKQKGLDHRGQIKEARCIEERAESVKNRSHFGHWERDTMQGAERKGGLLVCVERKYRYVRLAKLLRRTAEKTATATCQVIERFSCSDDYKRQGA